uniref:Uncharacterized mitochondrial protein AtMg00810-like n=1 Tax=Tanacetum cinerariifolium TaxID=118510 RepID=A0A6L2NHU3_TANCI|nr:uncharacterized mitochondrial protein AtMg00810-like [Tanacetum cinerariifolium]
MFDEYFNHPSIAVSLVQEAAALRDVVLANSHVSTSIDQDAPSTSMPSTQEQEHSPTISQGFEESPKTPHFHDDPLHESLHEDSTSQGSSSNEFLNGELKEEVYVSQPEGFVDQDNLSHVYKIKKALYSLKQALRAWYDMLSSFLILQHFSKGAVYPTLFTRKAGNDLLLAKPTEKHLNVVKQIFRYLKGTINIGLWNLKDTSMYLIAYADSDHAGCQDTRRSTSGSAQFLGDKLVTWSSKKQKSTAISSIEAEYISLSGCCAQILWMRSQLIDYGFHFNKIPLYYDKKV